MSSSVKSVHFQVQIIRGLCSTHHCPSVYVVLLNDFPDHSSAQSTHARIAPSNSRFILSVSPPTKAHSTWTTRRDIISSWVDDGRTSSSNLIFTFIQPPTTHFICLFFQFIMHQFRASLKVSFVTCERIAGVVYQIIIINRILSHSQLPIILSDKNGEWNAQT